MHAREPSPAVVRFGPFALDPHTGELRKGGLAVAVPEQPLRVLLLLLERPGEVVTREELRQRLWPAETTASFDQSLNSAVRRLRELLGDVAESPLYIETVPRRGYRFIADATSVAARPAPGATPRPAGRGRILAWKAAAVALFVAGVLVFTLLRRSRPAAPALAPTVVPLTSYSGREYHPSLSPDGTRVAFLWDGDADGPFDVYEKVIGSETLLRLTRDRSEKCCPSWSADGRSIAFLKLAAERPDREPGALCIVPALGGSAQCIAAVRTWFGSATSWSPDGRTILVSASPTGAGPPAVLAVSVPDGATRALTQPEKGVVGDAFPAFSPDGASIAFARFLAGGDALTAANVLVVRVDGGAPRTVLDERWIINGLDWTREGDAVIVAGGERQHRLWRVPREGGRPRALLEGPDGVLVNAAADSVTAVGLGSRVSVARTGGRLAFSRGFHDTDVWRLALAGEGLARGAPERWLVSTRLEEAPHFAPDGRRVAFASTRASSTPEIWLHDGGAAVQLTTLGVHSGTPRFSPDGRRLAFDSRAHGQSDIHLLDVDTRQVRALTSSAGEDVIPSWSPDGRTVYFASDRDGTWRLFAIGADGGGERALGIEGFAASAAADGSLFYTKFGRTGLWRAAVGGSVEAAVLDDLHCWGYWALSPAGVYHLAGPGDREIHFRPHGARTSRRVAEMPGPAACGEAGLAVSPDGRTALVVAASQGSDLMLADGVP